MAICSSEFQRQIILPQKTDTIRASVLNIWSHSFQFCLLFSSSLSLMLSCTVPLGSTSAFLEFLHSLSLSLPVLSKTQLFVAFSLHAGALTLTLTTSIGIWHSAGATKSWLHSCRLKKSFVGIKKVSVQPKFSIEMGRETLGDDSQPWIGDTKKFLLIRKRYGATKYWSLVVELSSSCRFSLISHPLHFKSLYFSLP